MREDVWHKQWDNYNRRYRDWWKDHKDEFLREVQNEYLSFSEHERHGIIADSDFAFFVGVPLVLLWALINAYFCKPQSFFNEIVLAVIIITLGCLIRYYAYHLSNVLSWRYFRWHRYPDVVSQYIEEHLEPATWKSLPENEVEQFRKHCKKELLDQGNYISYHSKPAKK